MPLPQQNPPCRATVLTAAATALAQYGSQRSVRSPRCPSSSLRSRRLREPGKKLASTPANSRVASRMLFRESRKFLQECSSQCGDDQTPATLISRAVSCVHKAVHIYVVKRNYC